VVEDGPGSTCMEIVPPKTTLDAMLPLCKRDDAYLCAGLIESSAWASHLRLLEFDGDVSVGARSSEIGSVGTGQLSPPYWPSIFSLRHALFVLISSDPTRYVG
jgi:hypothetical protein